MAALAGLLVPDLYGETALAPAMRGQELL